MHLYRYHIDQCTCLSCGCGCCGCGVVHHNWVPIRVGVNCYCYRDDYGEL